MWKKDSEMVYYAKENAQALTDLNNAINALYALDVGAMTCDTRGTSADIYALINSIGVDFATWANKLKLFRSLVFGNAVDWEYANNKLHEILENK